MILLPTVTLLTCLSYIQATIMKPAVMIGTEDRIMNRWARFAKKWSFLPLIGGGTTKYAFYCLDT